MDIEKVKRELIEEQRLVTDAITTFEGIAKRRTKLAKAQTPEEARDVPEKVSSRKRPENVTASAEQSSPETV